MMSAREWKMPFGKYKGETLEEIYVENVGYLEWILDEFEGREDRPQELSAKIRECFKEMRSVRICK